MTADQSYLIEKSNKQLFKIHVTWLK